MPDLLLVLAGILSALSIGAALEYYRQLRKAQREYEKARESVDDIILSFNRQIKRESENIECVTRKVESDSSKIDRAIGKLDETESKVQAIETTITTMSSDRDRLVPRLDELDRKAHDAATSLDALTLKISNVEGFVQQSPLSPEPGVEAVIPIRRDRALSKLTETELSALEYLAGEGSKTAPEIKDRLNLSREHTARLMKKLYEEGYLERDTDKIPFKYSVKKEMEKFLKKTENPAA